MKAIIHSFFTLFVAVSFAEPANPFFAMDTIAHGKSDIVVPLLKELGYDGLGGTLGDDVMAKALEANGLCFFNGYYTLALDEAQSALNAPLKIALDRMQGHHTTLWLGVTKIQKDGKNVARSSPDGDEIARIKLGEIADYAKDRGLKLALYHHTGFWMERVEDALRIANKLNRDDVGVTFNLCHWLKVEGDERDPLPVLKAAMPRLMFVTINGADSGYTKDMNWDRLIQPLGKGSFDVSSFMQKVWSAGYNGPVGFQGFGIRQEPRTVLAETMKAWRELLAKH